MKKICVPFQSDCLTACYQTTYDLLCQIGFPETEGSLPGGFKSLYSFQIMNLMITENFQLCVLLPGNKKHNKGYHVKAF